MSLSQSFCLLQFCLSLFGFFRLVPSFVEFEEVVFELSLDSGYNSVNTFLHPDPGITMTDVTRILNAIEGGNTQAVDELLPLIYEELRVLAAQKLSHELPGQTLQATALVHEAYIRLVEAKDQSWKNRGHFFKAAAESMRRILVENARRKKSVKRGGEYKRIKDINVFDLPAESNIDPEDLISLDEALVKLDDEDQTLGDLIKLHCFAGLPLVQVADILAISSRTAERHWAFARAWLNKEIFGEE